MGPTSLSGERAKPKAAGGKAATAAVVTTGVALAACAVCCTVPIAFPALALAGGGVLMAILGAAYRVLTVAGLVVVAAAWVWVLVRGRRGRRPARRTIQGLTLATVSALLAALWPIVEHVVLRLIR
jgi:hypothetical protein